MKTLLTLTLLLLPTLSMAKTAFYMSETTEGETKICKYDYLGTTHIRKVGEWDTCPINLQLDSPAAKPVQQTAKSDPWPRAFKASVNEGKSAFSSAINASKVATQPAQRSRANVMAFKTGERTTGMTKVCYYKAFATEYAKEIGSLQFCPQTIKVAQ